MVKFIFISIVLTLNFCGFAQNLIPNPSFEGNIGCPTATGQVTNSISWFGLNNHSGTPDYFNTCGTSPDITVPTNAFGVELAATGNAYMGFSLIDFTQVDYREYVEIQLLTPLVAGETYAVSFQYSLSDNSNFSTSDLGIYFSAASNTGAGNSAPFAVVPQLNSAVTLSNKAGWVSVTQLYVASGGEQYMLFGNFLNDALTTTNALGNFGFDGAYVYIDDFLVEKVCDYSLGNDTVICQGQSLLLDATAPNATYQWQNNSTNAMFTVTQPGTYWVEITNFCGTITDTIVVGNNQPITLDFGNDTVLCTGNTWLLDATNANATYTWQDNSTDPTFTVSQQGAFWVEVTNGCQTLSDTVNVLLLSGLIVNLGGDQVLCQGDIVTLNATSPISTYLWQDNSTNPTFTVTQPGTYIVEVFAECDTTSDTVAVAYFEPDNFTLGNDTVLCLGESLLLDVTSPNAAYVWQDNSINATFNVTQQGNYWVDFTNNCGSASDTITVSYLQSLNIDLGNDTILCEGASLQLDVTEPNLTYLWQDNSSNSTQTVTGSGLYSVEVSTAGCSVFESILVDVQTVAANYDFVSTAVGCPIVNQVSFTDQSAVNFGSIITYQWDFNDGTISAIQNPTYGFNTFGDYPVDLLVTSNLGCTAIFNDLVEIPFYEEIIADFTYSPNEIVANETGVEFTNLSDNSDNWIWDFGDGVGSTEKNPVHKYESVGTYTVSLIAANGIDCDDSSSTTLVVREQIQVFVPNAFTPDGNGPNNNWEFSVLGIDIYDFSLTVYNRWGEIVWQSFDASASWNGEFNGAIVPAGSYVWQMEINNTANAKGQSFSGSLTVLR